MAGINMGSILSKLDSYLGSPSGAKKMDAARDKRARERVYQAGCEFANTLIRTVHDTVFDTNVANAIDYAIDVGSPIKISQGQYCIHVYIGDTTRETMSTYKDYYPIQLANLYDQGVGHVMPQLFETDPSGVMRVSRTFIDGANYMEQAVSDFLGNYGSEYNVISININRNE